MILVGRLFHSQIVLGKKTILVIISIFLWCNEMKWVVVTSEAIGSIKVCCHLATDESVPCA